MVKLGMLQQWSALSGKSGIRASVVFSLILKKIWFPSKFAEKTFETIAGMVFSFLLFRFGKLLVIGIETLSKISDKLSTIQTQLKCVTNTVEMIGRRLMNTVYYSSPECHECIRQLVDNFLVWDTGQQRLLIYL